MTKCRLYLVKGWQPPGEGSKYGRHHIIGVVATNAMRAGTHVSECYSGFRIDGISEAGMVHHVIDEP